MSFGWNCMFRRGQWLEFRRFVLLQRQNIPYRITHINKELQRIGHVRVLYERIGEGEDQKITEKRVGLEVEVDSSLGKLLKAYIAQGGNPFDISMFLQPDSYEWVERTEEEPSPESGVQMVTNSDGQIENIYKQYTQPYGGVLSPRTATVEESEHIDASGWLPIWKFPPRRLGGQKNIYPRADEIGGVISHARKWVTQEISHLRNNIEARIIKLCDLREQLMIERDDTLYNALSGTAAELKPYNSDLQLDELHLSHIVTNIDLNYFEPLVSDEEAEDNENRSEQVSQVTNEVPDFSKPIDRSKDEEPYYISLLEDVNTGEDDNTAL